MAGNKKTGTLIVSSRSVVVHEGNVEHISDSGVTILSREFGRQTKVENFYSFSNIVAHSDVGPGFVAVIEDEPIVVYNGNITTDKGEVSVETEGGRVITVGDATGISYRIIYDGDDGPTTVIGKEGRRRSNKLDTRTERESEKKPAKSDKKSDKKKPVGKRRD